MPAGVRILDAPRHALSNRVDSETVTVLNQRFAIAPPDALRACEALFRALPRVLRIHMQAPFQPHELSLHSRVLDRSEDMVINLPATVDEYKTMLSSHSRKNLRNYENRLRRRSPDVITKAEVVASGNRQRSMLMIDTFARWNRTRRRSKQKKSKYEDLQEVTGARHPRARGR